MSEKPTNEIGVPQHLFTDEIWNGVLGIYAENVLQAAVSRDLDDLFNYTEKDDVLERLDDTNVADYRFGSYLTPQSKLEVKGIRDQRVTLNIPSTVRTEDELILEFCMEPNIFGADLDDANWAAQTLNKPDLETMMNTFRGRVAEFLIESGVAVSVIARY